MKYLITLITIFFYTITYSQGYVQVNENEPFRRANLIVIQSDTIPKNTFTVVAKTLVKHGFILDKLMPEYGIITTELRESRKLQMKLNIIIDDTEVKITGSYKSRIVIGMDAIQEALVGSSLNSGSNASSTIMLDYRNDLSIYYDEMTEIATTIKGIINAKKLIHVERGETTKF